MIFNCVPGLTDLFIDYAESCKIPCLGLIITCSDWCISVVF